MTVVKRRTATTPAPPEPEAVAAPKDETCVSWDGAPFLGERHQRVAVGIDASLTGTAIAFLDLDTGAWSVWRHKPQHKGVRRLLEIERFVHYKLSVLKLISDEVSHICMEGYAFSRQMAHSIGEGGGSVKRAIVAALGMMNKAAYPSLVAPNTLKKFTTGNGSAEKSDMKLTVFKRWGAEFKDDNQCDAFALAQMAGAWVDAALLDALPQYARDSLAKMTVHAEWDEAEVSESLRRPEMKTA